MLAKNANDNADILGNRAVRKLFASKLAPTADRRTANLVTKNTYPTNTRIKLVILQ